MVLLSSITLLNAQTTVNYVEQTTYFNVASNFISSTAGSYNPNAHQMGMYAHGGGTQQIVAWRQFKTAGNVTAGTTRSLQVGDQFQISFSNCQVYGQLGVALLASPSTRASWNDRWNNAAMSVNLEGPGYTGSFYGSWYSRYYDGTTANNATTTGSNLIAASTTSGTYKNFTITFTLTAPNRMNVSLTDGSTTSNMYDLLLNTTTAITDYAVYFDNDYDGGANHDAFVSTSSSTDPDFVKNNSSLPIGSSNGTFTVSTIIPDPTTKADGTASPTANALTINGTGAVTLSGTNTYTGASTISAGSTLKLGNSAALGGTGTGTTISSGGVLDMNGTNYSSAEPLNVTGTGISSGGAIINSSATASTYAGLLTLGGATTINGGSGTIAISNAGTISGATFGLTLGGSAGGSITSIIGTTSGTVTAAGGNGFTITLIGTGDKVVQPFKLVISTW